MISHNHATRPKKVYKANRSDKLWLPEYIEAFREKATPEMAAALELALWTGQRQSDIVDGIQGWPHRFPAGQAQVPGQQANLFRPQDSSRCSSAPG